MARSTPEGVVLVPYDEEWPALFRAEAKRIRAVLGDVEILHVGSTSVPGLGAKPFIDILVGVDDDEGLAAAVPALCSASYRYVPEAEKVVAERRFFRRLDESPGYHVHVVVGSVARGTRFVRNLVTFRDALRVDSDVREAYLGLKRRLALEHAGDVDAYTVAKGAFVEKVLAST